MRYLKDPRQNRLFDSYALILSSAAYERLLGGWQHLFRQAILELLPAPKVAEHFSADQGRPTKEIYSILGLVLIMEFKNWTMDEAVDAYLFDAATQYALNLEPEGQSLSERTLERYLHMLRSDDLAAEIMQTITRRLAELLELDVSEQRLDSTHIESNMATFGRTRLMGVAIKNFLTQLKRHDETNFQSLPSELRERYEPARNQMFGDWAREGDWSRLRQVVAEDMHLLVERYARDPNHSNRSTYKSLVQIFLQQCEVVMDKVTLHETVTVREKTGGNIVVNPSDPDATYDGHKGSGYQVQLSETCSDKNDVQLITAAIPQTAVESDANSLSLVLEVLEETQLMPQEMLADTSYGSDANHQLCQKNGIELIAPTPGTPKDKHASSDEAPLSLTEFQIEIQDQPTHWNSIVPTPVCVACPAGIEPHRSHYDYHLKQLNILHDPEVCGHCSLRHRCPTRYASGWAQVTIPLKDVRLQERRQYERTEEFRTKYRKRSGIEATNSILKRTTGIGRLRVRGRPAVFTSILLKVAGWNILRAASARRLLERLRKWRNGGRSAQTGTISYPPSWHATFDFGAFRSQLALAA